MEVEREDLLNPDEFLDYIERMTDREIGNFETRKGVCLVMLAAEKGHERALRNLTNRGFDIDSEVDGNLPIDVAYENKHFNIIHHLLRANSRFPRNFEFESLPENLKSFYETTKLMHESIAKRDEDKICEIVKENPSVRHFYNLENKSAVSIALEDEELDIYKLLISQKVYLGPHEEMFMVLRDVGWIFREKLRKLHLDLSKSFISEPMLAIAKNCFIGPDVPDQGKNFNFIHEAFRYLFNIEYVAKYLEVVAASREFRIVFDFNRATVEYLDPNSEPYTDGLCYEDGKIYIGAKNMLDPSKKFYVFSVIAHELCHYAMFLVFENEAKPYKKNDEKASGKLQSILQSCEGCDEEIVESVFKYYEEDLYHTEIIVRAPQLLVLYHETPEVLEKEEMQPLLNYFKFETIPQVVSALPRIKVKFMSKNEKKIKRQRKIIFSLGSILSLLLLISVPLGLWFHSIYTPKYSWETMTEEEKSNFKSAIVSYHGNEVEFGKLFRNDSEIFDRLPSEHFRQTLNGNTTLISKDLSSIYDDFVFLEWNNMTQGLRDNFLNYDVTFQGYDIKLDKLLNSSSECLKLLKPNEIRNILNGILFKISRIEQNSKFSYERYFIKEVWKDVKEVAKSSENVFDLVEENRVFLLSSAAGEGKSTIFKHFWFKLKERYPEKWIEYVDLKKYISSLEKGKDLNFEDKEVFKQFLSDILLQLNDFELKLFYELYDSNRVVFLWDGIDEISPFFKYLMLNLVANIKDSTSNFQFISTRPQHSDEFQKKLEIESFKLRPLSSKERFEFLVLCLGSLFNLNLDPFYSLQIDEESFVDDLKRRQMYNESIILEFEISLEKSNKLLQNLDGSNDTYSINNPLMLLMLAEIVTSDKFNFDGPLNYYKFYEVFIEKKLNIIYDKGEFVKKDSIKVFSNPLINLSQIHQVYAIKLILPDLDKELKELRIFKFLEKSKELDISRYGLLTIKSDGYFDFIHRTFAEFFCAQFLITNAEEYLENSALNFLPFLESGFFGRHWVIRKFMLSYVRNAKSLPKTFEFFREQEKLGELLRILDTSLKNYIEFAGFTFYLQKQGILNVNESYIGNLYLYEKNCVELIKNWDAILENLQKDKFKTFFLFRDTYFGTTLNSICYNCEGKTILKILLKMKETFGYDFVIKLILAPTEEDHVNMIMIDGRESHFFKVWQALEIFLKVEDQKILLTTKDKNSRSILELAALTQERKFFINVFKAYFKNFSKLEIEKFLLRETKSGLKPLLYYEVVESSTLEICDDLQMFTEEIFDGNATNIENFLNTKNANGTNIFSYFKDSKDLKVQMRLNKLKNFILTKPDHFVNLVMTLANRFNFEIPLDGTVGITKENLIDNLRHSGKFDGEIFNNFSKTIEKSEKIFKEVDESIDESFISRNLLIPMVVEIATGLNFLYNETLTLYRFYEMFIDIKIRDCLMQKQEDDMKEDSEELEFYEQEVGEEKDQINEKKITNLVKFLQFNALKQKWSELQDETKRKLENFENDLADKVVASCGIWTFKSDTKVEFVDQSFQDFLIAQFIVSNINDLKDNAEHFLPLLNSAFYSSKSKTIKKFMVSYMDNAKDLNWALDYLHQQKNSREHLIISGERLKNYLEMVDFVYYLEQKEIVNASQRRHIHSIHVDEPICVDLIQAWDRILLKLGKDKFKKFFMLKDTEDETFLIVGISQCQSEILSILQKMSETFDEDFIFEVISQKGTYGWNALMEAASNDFFSNIWTILEKILKVEHQQILLKVEDEESCSILEHTAHYKSINDFEFVTSVFLRLFSKQETQKFLLRETEVGIKPILPFVVFKESLPEICDHLAVFINETFDGNATNIKNFLKTNFSKNFQTIFDYVNSTNSPGKIKCLDKLKALYEKK